MLSHCVVPTTSKDKISHIRPDLAGVVKSAYLNRFRESIFDVVNARINHPLLPIFPSKSKRRPMGCDFMCFRSQPDGFSTARLQRQRSQRAFSDTAFVGTSGMPQMGLGNPDIYIVCSTNMQMCVCVCVCV